MPVIPALGGVETGGSEIKGHSRLDLTQENQDQFEITRDLPLKKKKSAKCAVYTFKPGTWARGGQSSMHSRPALPPTIVHRTPEKLQVLGQPGVHIVTPSQKKIFLFWKNVSEELKKRGWETSGEEAHEPAKLQRVRDNGCLPRLCKHLYRACRNRKWMALREGGDYQAGYAKHKSLHLRRGHTFIRFRRAFIWMLQETVCSSQVQASFGITSVVRWIRAKRTRIDTGKKWSVDDAEGGVHECLLPLTTESQTPAELG